MKTLTAIGFFLLVLYQMIGVPMLVLRFDQTFESATPVSETDEWIIVKLPISLPYTMSWQNPDGQEGLVQDGDEFYNITHQEYTNDTLYTVLKTNQNARERFFELTEDIRQLTANDSTTPETPIDGLLKLLKNGISAYVIPQSYFISPELVIDQVAVRYLPMLVSELPVIGQNICSPPPEA